MADLEEGELPSDDDSNNEGVQSTPQQGSVQAPVDSAVHSADSSVTNLPTAHIPAQPFRNSKLPVAGLSSSDESSDDSDDSCCDRWVSKAKKIKVENMEMGNATSNTTLRQSVIVSPAQFPARKVNNIWGAVLQEQTLSHTMIGLGVDKVDEHFQMDRDVESYDFTRAKLDARPHKTAETDPSLESHDPFDNVIGPEQFGQKKGTKRRRPVKERLGKKKTKETVFTTIEPKLDDNEAKVASDIVTELEEPNADLVGRVVRVLGIEKSLHLLKKTQKTEAEGGILTLNQDRRRTPGGVYIFLLKTDPDVKKEHVKAIFYEDAAKNKKDYRANQKKKLQKMRQQKRENSFDISEDIKECLEEKAKEIREKIKQEVDMEEANISEDIKERLEEKAKEIREKIKQEVDMEGANISEDIKEHLACLEEKAKEIRAKIKQEVDMEEVDLQTDTADMISLE